MLEPASGQDPGLYVVLWTDALTGPDAPIIAGFWVVFGAGYLSDGTAGPPDHHPPYASGILEAVTEEVWWRNLPVHTDRRGTWRPVIVLEWSAPLAIRSTLPPPGVAQRGADDAPADAGEVEAWLDPIGPSFAPPSMGELDQPETSEGEGEYDALPAARSLVAVVQGNLTYTSSIHRAFTCMVPMTMFERPPAPGQPIPLDQWFSAAGQPLPDEDAGTEEHGLGEPIALPGGRVGFPVRGWLTRRLDVWPPRPGEVAAGTLSDRVVQTKWKGQIIQATASMLTVLTLVMGLAIGVKTAAEPELRATRAPPPPAPQPVLSVCSADHQQFVDEFRCQIGALAQTDRTFLDDEPVCADPGSQDQVFQTRHDLQAEFCGLYDRAKDSWTGNLVKSESKYNFAHLAAAKACFNVLGHPYTYAQSRQDFSQAQLKIPDPDRFLNDPELKIRSLELLVSSLEDACDTYGERVEGLVQGAMFSTHVGLPVPKPSSRRLEIPKTDSEPSKLRALLGQSVTESMGRFERACFLQGFWHGTIGDRYAALCGEYDTVDQNHDTKKIWQKLLGAPPEDGGYELTPSVTDRYVSARFGLGRGKSPRKRKNPVWSCHLTLDDLEPPQTDPSIRLRWGLTLNVPRRYDISGGSAARSQLQVDAAIRTFNEEAGAGGVCWKVVYQMLENSYEPLHPLLADLNEASWPSEEQQLCGQICAAVFRLEDFDRRDEWVSLVRDLSRCIDKSPPPTKPFGAGPGLDALRLPWNGAGSRGWQTPTEAQICSFNLMAQGYFQSEEASYIVGGRDPLEWAGETASGSKIAGGFVGESEGLASKSIKGMYRYGSASSWSVNRCGHVAGQCFTSLMMQVMGNQQTKRYEWLDRWRLLVEDVAKAESQLLAEDYPWCLPLQDYLSMQRETSAQFDAPCRQGVETARTNAELAIRVFASGRALASSGE